MSVNISLSISKFFRNIVKMSSKVSMESIKANAALANQTLADLKDELTKLNNEYNNAYAEHLREENRKLTLEVEKAKKRLIEKEIRCGIAQIPIPGQNATVACVKPTITQEGEKQEGVKETKDVEKPKKEKKVKEAKPKGPLEPELPIDVGRLDLRIGKVEDVQRHPDADSLYVLKIKCGEEKPRTVCSGLVKFMPIEDLQNKIVMVLCNLKPVKMRGINSEAMVMCASTPDFVEVLIPPNGCQAGDLVHCDGYTRQPDSVMNPKKKIFETVAPDLHTNGNLEACYKNVPFQIIGKGTVITKSLKNVQVK